jgi:hypothetical protein
MLLKRLETRKWREEFVYNKWLSTLSKNNKPCCVVDTHKDEKWKWNDIMFRAVFWVVLPCKMIVDRRFRGAYCLHHQGWNPEDSSEHHTRRRENLKSHEMILVLSAWLHVTSLLYVLSDTMSPHIKKLFYFCSSPLLLYVVTLYLSVCKLTLSIRLLPFAVDNFKNL